MYTYSYVCVCIHLCVSESMAMCINLFLCQCLSVCSSLSLTHSLLPPTFSYHLLFNVCVRYVCVCGICGTCVSVWCTVCVCACVCACVCVCACMCVHACVYTGMYVIPDPNDLMVTGGSQPQANWWH